MSLNIGSCQMACANVACLQFGCQRSAQQRQAPAPAPANDPFGLERASRDALTKAINRLSDILERTDPTLISQLIETGRAEVER